MNSKKFDLDIYQKPSNLFLFLPQCSYHPEHAFKGWIRGYIGRLRINCTDDLIYHLRRQQFWDQLLARGYAEVDLTDFFQYNPQRSILMANIQLLPKGHKHSSLTFFKLRYSPRTAHLMPTIKKALTASTSMLANPSIARQLSHSEKPIIVLRNSSKFGNKLISAKLHPNSTDQG